MWTLQDAKNRFSAVVNAALAGTPQKVTRRGKPPAVDAWAKRHRTAELYFAAAGEAEVRCAAAIMPRGRRRDTLVSDMDSMPLAAFDRRIPPFGSDAATAYAEMAAARRRSGRPVSQSDCQIATIARSRGMAVATRNLPDFSGIGIDVIDPWGTA
ncbi:MAG: type II toxin-antitoxin system prevent-host-death family antitoxin [Defluviicoccus sp.]|nr:type II toxin-antitoxin system prevent-host-death family antitoxin [Defluviicoccus sp.]